jgi:NOL1/NOP2/sun family putative RNA methylase
MEIFKPKFIERYKKILGKEIEKFLQFSSKPLIHAIRANTLKISTKKLIQRLKKKGWEFRQVPWYEDGFWVIKPEYNLGNTLEHSLGYFYVQEAASMLPPLVLKPKQNEIVLDLCASPGSKTTQMAQLMKNTGIIVANDIKERINPLVANLQRCGVINTIVTRMDGRFFSKVRQRFDKVLVDAPCSGTGAIRKDYSIAKMWNPNMIKGLSKLQKSLLLAGFDCLTENGVLVYSTCSLEPEENEEVVDLLLKQRENAILEKIKIKNIKLRKALKRWEEKEYDKTISKCVRIYPQDNDTEGFFIAKVRKC